MTVDPKIEVSLESAGDHGTSPMVNGNFYAVQ
jgi:hypothetical protein